MNSITSKIFELSEPKVLYLKEEQLHISELAPDELLAETICSAISPGTETGAYRGASPLRPGKIYPRVVGYCNVARVIHTGKAVSKFSAGDLIFSLQSHRSAFKCSENDLIIKLDPKSDARQMATAYLYHLGYHALISGSVQQGQNVAVIGIGALGYTSCIMSEIGGSNTFALTNQAAPEMLVKHGIHCLKKDDSSLGQLATLTHNTGIDVVINTSNSWDDWLLAMKIVNKGGSIVNLGFPGRDEPLPAFNPLDPFYTYMKNITIKAICHLSDADVEAHEFRFSIRRNLQYIIDLIGQGRIKPDEIISAEINYKDLGKQYEQYLSRSSSALYTTILNW